MATEIEQLRQEAEALKNQIRVRDLLQFSMSIFFLFLSQFNKFFFVFSFQI